MNIKNKITDKKTVNGNFFFIKIILTKNRLNKKVFFISSLFRILTNTDYTIFAPRP